jgi:Histone deacetylase domain
MVNSILPEMTETCFTAELDQVWESRYNDFLILKSADKTKRNVNIPWLTKGMGDGDYMYAFQQVVMPIAREFDPDFVIGTLLYVLADLRAKMEF